jgi:hypothetical protein
MYCGKKHMIARRQQPVSGHPPTLLIVYLRPEQDEAARYHIDEELTTSGISARLIAQHVERVSLESAAPFVLTHSEKRLVYALLAPPAPSVIEAIAMLVTTGLILGFAIKGEIALGGEAGVINNLAR